MLVCSPTHVVLPAAGAMFLSVHLIPCLPIAPQGHDLVVVHADHTLVFHHTYTFW